MLIFARSLATLGFVAAMSCASAANAFTLPGLPSLPSIPNIGGTAVDPRKSIDDALMAQIARSLQGVLGTESPLAINPRDDFPTFTAPPGGVFHPRSLDGITLSMLLANADGSISLLPGDYRLTTAVFCLKAGGHSPDGHRYTLAPLRGARAQMIATLDWRAMAAGVPHWEMQTLSWALQSGAKYVELNTRSKILVDWLIPEYKSQLAESVEESLRRHYHNSIGRFPTAPSFDDALTHLGTVGQSVLEMRRLREELATARRNDAALRARLVPPGGSPDRTATPWSRVAPTIYERFTTSGNFGSEGRLDIRVLSNDVVAESAPARSSDIGPRVAALPSHLIHVPITPLFGNPHVPSIQPLAMAGGATAGPPWKIIVPNKSNQPGGWKQLKTFGVFINGGRSVLCPVTIGIPIISGHGTNTDSAANEAVEVYVPAAAQETTQWLNGIGDFAPQATICAHFRDALQNHMQGSFPGARVTR